MSFNFLIYGHNGWIGNQIIEILQKNNYNYTLGNVRVDDLKSLENELIQIKPTHVICLIGRTHGTIYNKQYPTIDYLEQPGKIKENVRDNLFSPILLAIMSSRYNFHLTYMGTGCIFEYDAEHPFNQEINGFTEDSKPNFFGSSYSIVKGYTDSLMHLYDNTVLNIRIRMPINDDCNTRNFITKITTYDSICSIYNSMTVLPELLPLVVDMAIKKVTGTINLTNPGLISHNEILEMYKEIVDPDFVWKNFSIEEQTKILAAGRSNNYLDTTRLLNLYPGVKNIKESVRDIMHKLKQNQINTMN